MRRLIALVSLLTLTACTTTAAPETDAAGRGAAAVPADAYERVDAALWSDPPDCVVVLPADVAPEVDLPMSTVKTSVARHLFDRVDRVFDPPRRDHMLRRLGLDLAHADDRGRFAELTGCRHAAAVRVWGGRAWGVVWAETQIGVNLALLSLTDGEILWQARRTARRGDGGLPLSPLSAGMAVGLAARQALDADTLVSVLEDAVRAAAATLSDLRDPGRADPQPFTSRNSMVRPLSSRK